MESLRGDDDLAAEDRLLQFAPAEPARPGDLDAVGPGFGVRAWWP